MGLGNRLRTRIKAWYALPCPIRPPACREGQLFSQTYCTVEQSAPPDPFTWARRRMHIGRGPGSALSLFRAQVSDPPEVVAWCEEGPRKYRASDTSPASEASGLAHRYTVAQALAARTPVGTRLLLPCRQHLVRMSLCAFIPRNDPDYWNALWADLSPSTQQTTSTEEWARDFRNTSCAILSLVARTRRR